MASIPGDSVHVVHDRPRDCGGAFLLAADMLLPHMHPGGSVPGPEGLKSTWRRTFLLITAITLHNIPEGFAVGVALGAAAAEMPQASMGAAVLRAKPYKRTEERRGYGNGFKPRTQHGKHDWHCFAGHAGQDRCS